MTPEAVLRAQQEELLGQLARMRELVDHLVAEIEAKERLLVAVRDERGKPHRG